MGIYVYIYKYICVYIHFTYIYMQNLYLYAYTHTHIFTPTEKWFNDESHHLKLSLTTQHFFEYFRWTWAFPLSRRISHYTRHRWEIPPEFWSINPSPPPLSISTEETCGFACSAFMPAPHVGTSWSLHALHMSLVSLRISSIEAALQEWFWTLRLGWDRDKDGRTESSCLNNHERSSVYTEAGPGFPSHSGRVTQGRKATGA